MNGLAEILATITTLISAIISIRTSLIQKRFISTLKNRDAYSAAQAVALNSTGFFTHRIFKRMVKSGMIEENGANYFLNSEKIDQIKQARKKRARILIPIIIVIIAAILFLTNY